MPSDGVSAARLNPDHSNPMPSSGLSASRLNPGSASTSPFDQLDPLRTRPSSGSSPQNKEDLSSVVNKLRISQICYRFRRKVGSKDRSVRR